MKRYRYCIALIAIAWHSSAIADEAKDGACFSKDIVTASDAFPALGARPEIQIRKMPESFGGIGDALNLAVTPEAGRATLQSNGSLEFEGEPEERSGWNVQLETTSKDSRVGLSYGYSVSHNSDLRVFSAELSASESENGDTELLRLGDINSDLGLKVGFSWFAPGAKPKPNPVKLDAYQRRIFEACKAANGDECKDMTATNALTSSACIEQYLKGEDLQLFYDSVVERVWAPFAGVSGEVGRKEFKFIDTTTGLESKTRHSPWSVEAFGGVVSPDNAHLFRVGLKYAESMKAQDEQTICQPPGAGGFQSCLTAPYGAPNEVTKELAVFEYRFADLKGQTPLLGIIVRAEYDFESEGYEIDVPVYLFKSGDGDLNGGIRFGVSDTDDGYIGLFVGQKFGVN